MVRTSAPQGAQAVLRAVHLLKAFSADEPSLSLGALAGKLGLNKTTAHRLLGALESEGLVMRRGVDGHWQLGSGLIALGSQALKSSDLRATARPALEAIAAATGETTSLDVLVGQEMLVFDGIAGTHRVSAILDIGTRWPLHACSTGKCMLADMSPAGRAAIQKEPYRRFTNHTITDTEQLERELGSIREKGYACSREELELDFVAVSAAFRGPLGQLEGAVSVGGPASRFKPDRLEALGKYLRRMADLLTDRYNLSPDAFTMVHKDYQGISA